MSHYLPGPDGPLPDRGMDQRGDQREPDLRHFPHHPVPILLQPLLDVAFEGFARHVGGIMELQLPRAGHHWGVRVGRPL